MVRSVRRHERDDGWCAHSFTPRHKTAGGRRESRPSVREAVAPRARQASRVCMSESKLCSFWLGSINSAWQG